MEEVTFFNISKKDDNLIHVGGFDNKIALYDIRNIGQGAVRKSKDLNGGIWRIDSKILQDGEEYLVVANCGGNEFYVLNSQCKATPH